MGKKRPGWKRRVVDTGIYQHAIYDAREGAEGEPSDGTAKVFGGSLQAWINAIENEARKTAESPANEIASYHAANAIWEAGRLQDWLRKNPGIKRSATPEKCTTALDAVHCALSLGRLSEALRVSLHEPDAKRGKSVLGGAKRAAAKTNGTNTERRRTDLEIKAEFARVYPAETSKKTLAYKRVAIQFETTERTIRRALNRLG